MIRFGKLIFKYKNDIIFNNFDLAINNKSITTIIGPNGCGKSTLIKILLGLLPYEGNVIMDGKEVRDNINILRKKIGLVLEKPDEQIVNEVVYDEIAYVLRNNGVDTESIDFKVKDISKKLGIIKLLNKSVSELNTNQKQLVCIASILVNNPKYIIFDEALSILDPNTKEKVIRLLNKLKTSKTIIIVSHDIEDTLYSDKIVVMNKGYILQGSKEEIYAKEKELNAIGYKLPFMVELSNRLMFYGLIDHVIYDMKEMVDVLWQ